MVSIQSNFRDGLSRHLDYDASAKGLSVLALSLKVVSIQIGVDRADHAWLSIVHFRIDFGAHL